MENSILNSVKKICDIDPSVTDFDDQLIMIVNSVFMTLHQIGVGPDPAYTISGSTETWQNFSSDIAKLEQVRPYVCYKTKLLFDPSANSTIQNAIKAVVDEYEWRLNVEVDIPKEE